MANYHTDLIGLAERGGLGIIQRPDNPSDRVTIILYEPQLAYNRTMPEAGLPPGANGMDDHLIFPQ